MEFYENEDFMEFLIPDIIKEHKEPNTDKLEYRSSFDQKIADGIMNANHIRDQLQVIEPEVLTKEQKHRLKNSLTYLNKVFYNLEKILTEETDIRDKDTVKIKK